MSALYLSGRERTLGDEDIIVSKTDLKGRITYANDLFLHFSGYALDHTLGAPHSLVRHPHMPRCVFKLLWDHLQQGREVFAYVLNRAANGDHYWVLAHVSASRDADGRAIGYHSNRRSVNRRAVDQVIAPLYGQLRDAEACHPTAKEGMAASGELLAGILAGMGKSYEEFIFTL